MRRCVLHTCLGQALINEKQRIAAAAGHGFENPLQEIALLQHLSAEGGHPHIIRVVETLHSDTELIPVLEYAPGGELYDVVVNSPAGRFDVNTARRLFTQLMSGACVLQRWALGLIFVDAGAVSVVALTYGPVSAACALQLLRSCMPGEWRTVTCRWRI